MSLKLLADAVSDLGDVEAAVPVIMSVAASLKANQQPNLTADQVTALEKLGADLSTLVSDAKSSLG